MTREPTWCGRMLSKRGCNYEDKSFKRIIEIPSPKHLGEIEDLVYISTWLTLTFPDFAACKAPFKKMMLNMKRLINDEKKKKCHENPGQIDPLSFFGMKKCNKPLII